jgi:HK97 family phage prohead protease
MERRKIEAPVELRADGEHRKVAGYGAVFNSETVIGRAFREKILPGAFKRAVSGDVFSFFNHDESKVLGRTKSGTLRLVEDENGLRYEVDLPDTSAARDLQISMDRGDVDGSSFMFDVPHGGDDWEFPEDGMPLRTIREANLYEVGPVTMPAYPDATAGLRSMEGAKQAADEERRKAAHNAAQARARIDARKAAAEQKFRGIKPE